jgi:hypothetical protein
MAQTYQVQDALLLAKKLGKGVPFTGVDVSIADIVNSTIWKSYPWRDTLLASPGNWQESVLQDGFQDFTPVPTDIYRMTRFWMTRTDTNPFQVRDISVAKDCPIDLVKKSPYAVRRASFQAGVNKFRLESAIQIPANNSWTLGGEYQPHPTKIVDVGQTFWFPDEQLDVFALGLVYWALRLADDSRAGTMTITQGSDPTYTGALADFMNAIKQMAAEEDYGNFMGYFPDDIIVTDNRRYYSSDVFPIL